MNIYYIKKANILACEEFKDNHSLNGCSLSATILYVLGES